MIYQVQHTTTYTYPGTVSVCHNVVYLRPRDSAQQVCTCMNSSYCRSRVSLAITWTFLVMP
jgi:uncharacterized paraquat-inducible protein A